MFINLIPLRPRFVKCVQNTLMEPRHIRSAAKHARTRGLALMGAARTLLLVQPLLLEIAMYVERLFIMTITNFYMSRYSSFVITGPSIQTVRRLTISAARHAQGVRTVHKEGLQPEVTVILVKVHCFLPPSPSSLFILQSSQLSVKPLDARIHLIRWEMEVAITARWRTKCEYWSVLVSTFAKMKGALD
jgi:hypothetical protein